MFLSSIINSSATWPPIATSIWANTYYFVIETWSPSPGRVKVAPRDPPLETIVALYSSQAPSVKRHTTVWPASWTAVERRSRSDMVSCFLSMPIMILSRASSKSFILALSQSSWTAWDIAVFTKLATSAPVNPGVIFANLSTSIPSSNLIFARKRLNRSFLPLRSGLGMCIFLSNQPGQTAAGSRLSSWFVAPITTI